MDKCKVYAWSITHRRRKHFEFRGHSCSAATPQPLSGRREGVRESVPYLKSSFIRNLVRLQDVYFLPPVTCCLLFLGCRSSVLWLAIICTTWSRKRAHVVCGRGSKMHRAPSSRFSGHVPPAPPLPSTTGRLGSLHTPRLNTMQSERYIVPFPCHVNCWWPVYVYHSQPFRVRATSFVAILQAPDGKDRDVYNTS